ncbi:ATP-binding protein [Spirillospora sp. NPDC029432]|uniref:ATP-binding protein n=1 Tax=Spirillospora sp. NPDC029432 TaxID=3154599 RepID=UPI003452AB9A
MDVPGTEEAIPFLRRWVRLLLGDEPELAEAFELIASEYGTNALWHSASGAPGGRIRIEFCVDARRARLTVLDEGPVSEGGRAVPEDVDEHGRGLVLAGAYADQVGYGDSAGGRAAWASIDR